MSQSSHRIRHKPAVSIRLDVKQKGASDPWGNADVFLNFLIFQGVGYA
jgi:hypothetical protein